VLRDKIGDEIGDEIYEFNDPNEIFVKTVEWLIKNNRIKKGDLPFPPKKLCFIHHTPPKLPTEKERDDEKKNLWYRLNAKTEIDYSTLPGGWYYRKYNDITKIVKNTKEILEKFGDVTVLKIK
jgi:hypothetical protein